MKNLLLTTALLLVAFCLLQSACNNSSKDTATETADVTPLGEKSSSPIEGTWEVVWGKYGDNVRVQTPEKPFVIKQFDDKHFSLTAIDSTGKVQWASFGTYELAGNVYKETHVYHSDSTLVGGYSEWNYEIQGDSLLINGPTKVMDAAGKDLSKDIALNSMREVRLRVK